MNSVRKVVTGHSDKGKSIIVSDELVKGVNIGNNKFFIQLWANDSTPIHPDNGQMKQGLDWFPKAGGHRFFLWVVPPQNEQENPSATKVNVDEVLPGFTKHFEQNNPGMHTTDSVDCTYLISGDITLEVDDQKKIKLNSGDTIIQNGTRHKWINEGSIPAVLITTCIGSHRK